MPSWGKQALLAAALLAGERTGAFRLEVRKKKALLGLRQVDSLYARPAGGEVAVARREPGGGAGLLIR